MAPEAAPIPPRLLIPSLYPKNPRGIPNNLYLLFDFRQILLCRTARGTSARGLNQK